jgi:cell division protein FtsL
VTQAAFDGQGDWREPRSGRSAAWLSVLLIVALAITLAGVFPFRQLLSQQRQVDTAQAQLGALQAQNAALEAEAVALQTPAEIERVAREELGLVRPGETGYAVQAPEASTVPLTPAADDEVVDDRTIVEKIWDFLTGRDLAPDG